MIWLFRGNSKQALGNEERGGIRNKLETGGKNKSGYCHAGGLLAADLGPGWLLGKKNSLNHHSELKHIFLAAEPRNFLLIGPLDAAFRVPQTLPNTLTEIHRDNRSE